GPLPGPWFRYREPLVSCLNLAQLVNATIGQLISALVVRMPRMPLHPMPSHFVAGSGLVQSPPQIGIFDRFFGGGAPTILLPARQPLIDSPPYVFRIGGQTDTAGLAQRL